MGGFVGVCVCVGCVCEWGVGGAVFAHHTVSPCDDCPHRMQTFQTSACLLAKQGIETGGGGGGGGKDPCGELRWRGGGREDVSRNRGMFSDIERQGGREEGGRATEGLQWNLFSF